MNYKKAIKICLSDHEVFVLMYIKWMAINKTVPSLGDSINICMMKTKSNGMLLCSNIAISTNGMLT